MLTSRIIPKGNTISAGIDLKKLPNKPVPISGGLFITINDPSMTQIMAYTLSKSALNIRNNGLSLIRNKKGRENIPLVANKKTVILAVGVPPVN